MRLGDCIGRTALRLTFTEVAAGVDEVFRKNCRKNAGSFPISFGGCFKDKTSP